MKPFLIFKIRRHWDWTGRGRTTDSHNTIWWPQWWQTTTSVLLFLDHFQCLPMLCCVLWGDIASPERDIKATKWNLPGRLSLATPLRNTISKKMARGEAAPLRINIQKYWYGGVVLWCTVVWSGVVCGPIFTAQLPWWRLLLLWSNHGGWGRGSSVPLYMMGGL